MVVDPFSVIRTSNIVFKMNDSVPPSLHPFIAPSFHPPLCVINGWIPPSINSSILSFILLCLLYSIHSIPLSLYPGISKLKICGVRRNDVSREGTHITNITYHTQNERFGHHVIPPSIHHCIHPSSLHPSIPPSLHHSFPAFIPKSFTLNPLILYPVSFYLFIHPALNQSSLPSISYNNRPSITLSISVLLNAYFISCTFTRSQYHPKGPSIYRMLRDQNPLTQATFCPQFLSPKSVRNRLQQSTHCNPSLLPSNNCSYSLNTYSLDTVRGLLIKLSLKVTIISRSLCGIIA